MEQKQNQYVIRICEENQHSVTIILIHFMENENSLLT